MRDVQEMAEFENTVYEAIGHFGAYGNRPNTAQLSESIGVPPETVTAALRRLVDEFGFVSGDESTGYRLVGRQNGPFSAA